MIGLSHVVSYLTCPRLCYYRIHFGENVFAEIHAVREIYFSFRQGFDLEWAESRTRSLYENFDEGVFRRAAEKFVYIDHGLRTVDFDVYVRSEKLGVGMVVDEIVRDGERDVPLFISLNPPEKGVWLRDVIKAGFAALIGFDGARIYYAYSGDLRSAETGYGTKRRVLKLIERVKMVERGFLPEKRESKYCDLCNFKEECHSKPETFASKFL
ncbi:PD-(D/E)XK nuclease family protein [Archaeoglobus neptunius]|uniref:hypothetical protein n=1 Tax=Archaeoglobus neptunius TaxID=2798580 RepID=UPI00192904C4|nr:hypothetical protein [Archaeoglobus neptunius]